MDEKVDSTAIDIANPRTLNIKHKDVVEKKVITTEYFDKHYMLPTVIVAKPIPTSSLKKAEVLLPYLRYVKEQTRLCFKHKMTIGVRDNYKIAYTEIKKHLHKDDPVDDCWAITNYDPTFFSCVQSSRKSNYVAPYKSLKYLYNKQFRLRQEVGYRRDYMLNIDKNFNKELELYDFGVKGYKEQVQYLDAFISADYTKSMTLLNKWANVKTAVDNKMLELQVLATEKFTINSKILGLDYKYGLQQKYGRFLYYLSPPSWRLKNRNFARSVEIEIMGFDYGTSGEEDTFNVIFENLKRECIRGFVKPVLYFQNPRDLFAIFDGIEQQQLHHFTHVACTAPYTCFLKKRINCFRNLINQDNAGTLNIIRELKKTLQFCEAQCLQLEYKFYKILNIEFYETVAAPEVLKLQMNLEFSYAELYNEKPTNLSVWGTAKALEDFYMNFSKRLESVTSNEIQLAIKRSIVSERNKFRLANIAVKELRLFKQIERALLRAYAPRNRRHKLQHKLEYLMPKKRS